VYKTKAGVGIHANTFIDFYNAIGGDAKGSRGNIRTPAILFNIE
jgi:hypothetical protein